MTGEEGSPDSESEGEASETPKATQGRPRRTSHVTSTRKRGAPVHLSGNSQPTLTSLPSPEHMTGHEDSSEDEEYVTSSTPVGNPPSTTEAVEDDRQSVAPEPVSDISNIAQALPDQTILEVDSEHEEEQESKSESDSDTNSPVPTAPRRSARSTKGIPPVHYRQVQTNNIIISELERPTRYKQVLYVPCYPSSRDRQILISLIVNIDILICHKS